jgi:hypothetical protein
VERAAARVERNMKSSDFLEDTVLRNRRTS